MTAALFLGILYSLAMSNAWAVVAILRPDAVRRCNFAMVLHLLAAGFALYRLLVITHGGNP